MSKRTISALSLVASVIVLFGIGRHFKTNTNHVKSGDLFTRTRALIQETLKKQKVPSISVAVAKDGEG